MTPAQELEAMARRWIAGNTEEVMSYAATLSPADAVRFYRILCELDEIEARVFARMLTMREIAL